MRGNGFYQNCRRITQRTLSDAQELRLQQLIYENRTEQLKKNFALWTRGAVR